MTTFITFTPPTGVAASPGSTISYKPRVNRAQFGDGYSQRTGDGLNAKPTQFELSFVNLKISEGNTINTFFQGQAGYKPFMFKIPGEGTARQWIASEWRLTFTERTSCDFSAMLEENFDP